MGLLFCSALHKKGEDEIISWRKPRMLIKEMAFWHSFLAGWSSQPSWYFMSCSHVKSFPVWFFLQTVISATRGPENNDDRHNTHVFDTRVFSQSDPACQLSKPAVSHRVAQGRLEEQHPACGVQDHLSFQWVVFMPSCHIQRRWGGLFSHLSRALTICSAARMHDITLRVGAAEAGSGATQVFLISEVIWKTGREADAKVLNSWAAAISWNSFEDLVLGP